MPKNPNHRRGSTVTHQGKTIRVDAHGYTMRPEDISWVQGLGGRVQQDEEGFTFEYPTKKAADTAFAGMVHDGHGNVDSVRNMRFVSEETAALAAQLGMWKDRD